AGLVGGEAVGVGVGLPRPHDLVEERPDRGPVGGDGGSDGGVHAVTLARRTSTQASRCSCSRRMRRASSRTACTTSSGSPSMWTQGGLVSPRTERPITAVPGG